MRLALSLLGAVLLGLGAGCLGDRGPEGPAGDAGAQGTPGSGGGGGSSCSKPGGFAATVALSSPTNGHYFVAGDRPVVTITFADACGQTVPPASLGSTADFFVVGPRSPLQTVTAYNLLNLTPAPFTAQGLKPLADGGLPNSNMTVQADGTIVYTLNPISTEAPGTYTAAVWAIGPDPLNQMFVLQDFQIGTTTVEPYATGPADGSKCANCHLNQAPAGKMHMAHIPPSFSPSGNYALDSLPIGSCKACHNNAGYSPNHLLRKTHGVHRGEHQQAAGVAHPEYGFGADSSLTAFLNVGFPSMPTGGTPGVALPASVAMEKDCTACHVNDAWMTRPSRAACGTCHDNVFFAGALLPDGGVDPSATAAIISPPTVLGFPSGTSGCTNDASCSGLSGLATCNSTTKNCELTAHAKQTDDAQCATCHGPTNGVSPIAGRHAISPWTPQISLEDHSLENVTVTGGTGPGGSFQVGDTLTLKFQLIDEASGASVADLPTNSAWAGTFLVAGPTSNPQRVYGAGSGGLNMKTTGTLTYDATSQTYTYVPSTTWPANSLTPVNNPGAGTQTNPAGNYTVWFYWAKTTPPPPTPGGVRDAIDAQVAVAFGVNQKATGRQVVTQAACGACHGMTQSGFPHLALHGGQRKNGETCSTCHSQNAFDRVVGSPGAACSTNSDCAGFAGGWEACSGSVCTVTVDPTPEVVVDYQQLVHNIHFARLRDGYAERNNLGLPPSIPPKTLNYLGFNNSLLDFQEILLPLDVRACTNCHQSTNATCSDSAPCGYGQTCSVAGKCANTAWQNPTARACITCHDSAESANHAEQNTFFPPSGPPVESCVVCHGPDAMLPVAEVHNITSPYVPPYPREKE
jgi:OmcA/MtrC family decaheme c-type cytochrome